MKSGLRGPSRASIVAYSGWLLLTCVIAGSTAASLHQIRERETHALLARSERQATALGQTMLRVFDGVRTLQSLGDARYRLMAIGNVSGAAVIEQAMAAWAVDHRFGIREVLVARRDGLLEWTSADPLALHARRHPKTPGRPAAAPAAAPAATVPPRIIALDTADASGLSVSRPALAAGNRWTTHLTLPLLGGEAVLVVAIDTVALSKILAAEVPGQAGEAGQVQRLSDGAILARTSNAEAAMSERPAADDPILLAASTASAGHWLADDDAGERLVGFEVPARLPVIVSQVTDTRVALADFYHLRHIATAAAALLTAATYLATRLLLANFLLRRRLAQQALHDPLTGLPNRRFFTDILPRKLRAAVGDGQTAAVLLIDLDGFKYINDTRGHMIGDALLHEVARRLRACAGQNDHVMRLGGDEFALVRIDRQQRRDATAMARFINSELSRIYEVEGYQLRVNVSVGVAFPPEGGESLNDLLRSADIALYSVKGEGGGGHRLFDAGMEETVRSRRALEMDLREALLRQELEVYYQPLVQLDPRRVSGFEALVRWHHPVHGMVMPGRFIPMAEETGLIAGIGQWVLRQACIEATRWPANTRVAVNISPVQFDRSDIVDVVASALRESRLDPGRLELEITEGVVLLDTGEALATMKRLQALGVRLALDDFGTGYSSLSYLRSFPFNKVKIDGSFLADLHGDGGAIIRAVLSLCTHLNLDTLVEGVEREDQLRWLRTEGCTQVQGHLFSEPMPAAALPQIMADVLEGGSSGARVVSFARKS